MTGAGTGARQLAIALWRRWRFAAAAALLVGLAIYLAYPSTTVVMGVQVEEMTALAERPAASNLDTLRRHLRENKARLELRDQGNPSTQKPSLEYMLNSPDIEFVVTRNTGAVLPAEVLDRYTSLGTVRSSPILLFVRAGETRIRNLRDLQGKRILARSSPEGSDKPLFSPGAKASIYSSDYIVEQFLKAAGVTGTNSRLINAWPERITLAAEWDVAIMLSLPSATSSERALWEDFNAGRVELARLEDLEGASRSLINLKLGRIAASTIVPARGLPRIDIPYLSYTFSAVVRKDLDPGLVVLLCEALQEFYGKPNLLANKNEFPSFAHAETFRPNPTAREFYRNGRPALSRYLEPTLAAFIIKLLLFVVPVIAVLWPLTHMLPSMYQFYIKHLLSHWYARLEAIDRDMPAADPETRSQYLARLDEMQRELRDLKFPILHLHNIKQLHDARTQLEKVRRKVDSDR